MSIHFASALDDLLELVTLLAESVKYTLFLNVELCHIFKYIHITVD